MTALYPQFLQPRRRLRPPAQGWRVFEPTLGSRGDFQTTPKVLRPFPNPCGIEIDGHNPFGVGATGLSMTQGRLADSPTLGCKTEHLRRSRTKNVGKAQARMSVCSKSSNINLCLTFNAKGVQIQDRKSSISNSQVEIPPRRSTSIHLSAMQGMPRRGGNLTVRQKENVAQSDFNAKGVTSSSPGFARLAEQPWGEREYRFLNPNGVVSIS